MRYHRSPKTGTYQICRAKNKCPYGGFHTESLSEIIEYCNQHNDILNMPLEKNKELAERDEEDYDFYTEQCFVSVLRLPVSVLSVWIV